MATKRLCSIPGCGKFIHARGWCSTHFSRWKAHGDPQIVAHPRSTTGICSVPDCEDPHVARGFCSKHYQRWKKRSHPNTHPKFQPVKDWINDHLDYSRDDCLPWPFATTVSGYGVINVGGCNTVASRYMCAAVHGEPPTLEHQAAHSCGNGHRGCVNPQHLRWDTPKGNAADRREHGTWIEGEDVSWSKVTEGQVKWIRAVAGTIPQSEIAEIVGLDRGYVAQIIAGKTWKHIL